MSNTLEERLLKAIERSEAAYHLYRDKKQYLQAKRIWSANTVIYSLLQEFYLQRKGTSAELTLRYIFHLEDWMASFEKHLEMLGNPDLNATFVFEREETAIAFPKEFKDELVSTIK
ncbi:MAG: hypothetical protein EOO01_24860 [Chitinophagaceae bacterium]|nr:MAG: hypothetical protein EOO01_24860 [Chitinophagaceae bacterium]